MSTNFSLESIVRSNTAARLGISNKPSETELRNIEVFLMPGLEAVRRLLGYAMYISSGFRSKELNAHIPGSSDTSAHTLGFAADFTCPDFGNAWAVCNKLADEHMSMLLRYDQIIMEYNSWVHISFDLRRRRLVTTKLAGQPYRNGLHWE